MSDSRVKEHVLDELTWQPSVDAASVGVSVRDAIVTLSGHVRSYAEKLAAERAVLRIHGVKALVSELLVSLPRSYERTDEDIAGDAAKALAWDTAVPKDAIKVTVTKGLVTLSGALGWSYQKRNAEHAVSRVRGVRGVINQIELKPSVQPIADSIRIGIEAALKRSAEVEAKTIHVETRGNTVVLTGTVSSWPERKAVERAAWAAAGVSNVEDKLLINSTMAAPGQG
jgi:osmotically-inducible protein OsmY